jgi:hypothetical protein
VTCAWLQVFLNLVLEFVPDTVYRISKHYSKAGQRMPSIYVKLYTYQVGPWHAMVIPEKRFFWGCILSCAIQQLDDKAAKPPKSRARQLC